MRISAACVLLAALALPMAANCGSDASTMAAHDDAKSDPKLVNHAKAETAASAAVSNAKSNSKSDLKMEKSDTQAAKKHYKVRKAAARPDDPGIAPPHDQSVCDLSPHPSWCDQ
jgi:hypothetical protein